MQMFSFTDYLESRMRDRTAAGRLAKRLVDELDGDEISLDALLSDEELMLDHRTRKSICELAVDYLQALQDEIDEDDDDDDDEE